MLKKFYVSYVAISLVYLLVIVFLRGSFNINVVTIFFGGVIGALLPDVDSLLYIFYLKPQELSSQRVRKAVSEKQFALAANIFYKSKDERKDLLFHSVIFQIMFILFSYYVIFSTASLFGRGLVISFLVHLAIDIYIDYKKNGDINLWMHNFDYNFSKDMSKLYVYVMFIVLLFLGLVV